jgi:hypothetical protein
MINKNNKNYKICLDLVKAEKEIDVIKILKKNNYWNDLDPWVDYGNNEANYSTIGNQQNAPDAALVEKIINSVDAVLMRECLKRDIDPEGKEAPQTTKGAIEQFFNIEDGILSNLNNERKIKLAENILVIATGKKTNPCYSIIDKGEGQTPEKMPETFLSIGKANKLRIPFVQGRYNMGGTGAIPFCGKHNFQLMISRRYPEIVNKEGDDGTSKYWGFTIIRRENPTEKMKNSVFKYLAPNKEILKFKAPFLPLLPGKYPNAYEKPLQWGSLIKLYEYKIRGLRTQIILDFNYRLATLLPSIALPLFLYERRNGFKAHTNHTILSGLSVRLEENKNVIIEPGFPSSAILKIKDQNIKTEIYAFKKRKKIHYARKEGIIFIENGQSHGSISKSFFTRKSVGMSYLEDSILILVDCSNLSGRDHEDLFMNSRDRLRLGDIRRLIEKKLEYLIKNHQGLKELREKRKRELIQGKIEDSKPLVEIIENVIKNSPTLSKLFLEGFKITNPFDLTDSGTKNEYKGQKYPTFFILKKKYTKTSPKQCPINQKFRIQFETDAQNDYFTRETHQGEFYLYLQESKSVKNHSLNLWNGVATLTIRLPNDVKEGDIIKYKTMINDDSRIDPFEHYFYVIVEKVMSKHPGGKGKRLQPAGEKNGDSREKPSRLDLPAIIEVYKNEWEEHGFTRESALNIMNDGEGGYQFFVNMDNCYLLTELKGRIKNDPKILKTQFRYGITLIGLSLLQSFEKNKIKNESPYKKIKKITENIAPFLLPMILELGRMDSN